MSRNLLLGLLLLGAPLLMVGVGIAEVLICTGTAAVCVSIGPDIPAAIITLERVGGQGIGLIETGTGFLALGGPTYIFYRIIRNRNNPN